MSQPVSFGLFATKGCKFEKELDFQGQIWLNNSVETCNRTLVRGCRRAFVTGFYRWGANVMKPGNPPFIGWRRLISAIAIIVGCLFAPAYCQTTDVALFLQQTPAKGGVITPIAGVYHFELNSEVSLTAIPEPGYKFVYWLGDVSDPAATNTMVYLDKPKIIIAVFEQAEYGVLAGEVGPSGGGGGGSGLVATVANYGPMGGMSAGTGGRKQKLQKPVVYPKGIEVIPEPATGVLLVLGSLFAFARRRTKSRPYSNL
jgi:hypothetical protein